MCRRGDAIRAQEAVGLSIGGFADERLGKPGRLKPIILINSANAGVGRRLCHSDIPVELLWFIPSVSREPHVS